MKATAFIDGTMSPGHFDLVRESFDSLGYVSEMILPDSSFDANGRDVVVMTGLHGLMYQAISTLNLDLILAPKPLMLDRGLRFCLNRFDHVIEHPWFNHTMPIYDYGKDDGQILLFDTAFTPNGVEIPKDFRAGWLKDMSTKLLSHHKQEIVYIPHTSDGIEIENEAITTLPWDTDINERKGFISGAVMFDRPKIACTMAIWGIPFLCQQGSVMWPLSQGSVFSLFDESFISEMKTRNYLSRILSTESIMTDPPTLIIRKLLQMRGRK